MSVLPTRVRSRIDYVDGLRAAAVLGVLISHLATHGFVGNGNVLAHVMNEGAHGVDLFFVISGFCLAYPTLRRWRAEGARFDAAEFMTKRIVRICPPFYVATLLMVAVGIAALAAGRTPPWGVPPALDLVKSLLFLDGHVQLINGAFWTLMVEFRWYFAFPLLLALWLRSPRAFLAVGAASAGLYHLTRAHGLDLGTLPGFMSGIVAADVAVGARLSDRAARAIRRTALPLALIGIWAGVTVEATASIPGFANADVLFPDQPTILGWQAAVFAMVVLGGEVAWLRGALALRPLVAVGVASYAIYLVHEPLVAVAAARFSGATGAVAAAVAALAAGFAFWAVVERPVTAGRLRCPLLDAVRPAVARAFALAGVPRVFTVARRDGERPEAVAVPQTQPLAKALY